MAIRFKDTISINEEYTFPLEDGTAGQTLQTDGSGNISFSTIGETVKIACKNTSGSTITKGTPVYVTGTVGASFEVEIAPADASNSAKMPAVGLLETDLANNGEGYVVTGGLLKNLTTDPIDGTNTASNDTIYVKAGGGLTMTKPTGSDLIQNIGKVGRVNSANAGSIVVSSILRTNDIPNLTEGKIWVGSANNTIESTVVHIDETNTRVGIGTNSPTVKLEINPSSGDADLILSSNGTQTLRLDQNSIRTTTTNDLTLFTNGNSNQLVLDSGGNIGIGTNSPTQKLDVNGNTILRSKVFITGGNYSESDLYILNTNNVNTGVGYAAKVIGVNIKDAVGSANEVYLRSNTGGLTSAGAIYLGSDSTAPNQGIFGVLGGTGAANTQLTHFFTINDQGNVGIGTTSPATKLQINTSSAGQDPLFAYNSSGINTFQLGHLGSDDPYFAMKDNSNVQQVMFRLDGGSSYINTGNVGIGTTSPASKIHIENTSANDGIRIINSTSGEGYIIFGDTADSNTGSIAYNHTDDAMTFDVNNSERVRIDSSGNVGIGTVSPSSKLEVVGGASHGTGFTQTRSGHPSFSLLNGGTNSVYLGIAPDGGSYNTFMQVVEDGTDINYLRFNTGAGTERLRIDSSGNVGIGVTSMTEKLEVNGAIVWEGALTTSQTNAGVLDRSGNDLRIRAYGATAGTGNLVFRTGGGGGSVDSEAMRLTYDGKLGIGTTSPDVKLEVIDASPTDGVIADFVNSTNAGGTVAAIKLSNADSEACDVILGANRVGANFGSDFFISLSDSVDGTNQERFRITEAGVATFTGPVISEGPDGGMVMREWTAAATYGMIGTANMSGDEYSLLTDGTDTFIGSGTGGTTYIRGGANDSSPEIRIDGSTIIMRSAGADTVLNIGGNSTGQWDPVINLHQFGSSVATEGAQIWYDNSVGDLHISTTYANDAADIHFYTRTGANKGTNNERLTISGNGDVIAAVNMQAPIFYDSNNTAFYLNPSDGATNPVLSFYGGRVLSRYVSSWTGNEDHDILYSGYATTLGDYVYLKAAGNSSTGLGAIVITDGAGFYFGTSSSRTGGVTNSATSPIANVLFRVDNSGNTYAQSHFDSINTTYYADFASLSNLNQVNMNGRSSMMYSVSDLNSVNGNVGVTGFKSNFGASNKPGTGNYATGIEFTYHDSNARTQLAAASSGSNNTGELWVRSEAWGASSWSSWWKLWHQGNDGASSGLDADLLDGWQTISGGDYWGGIPVVGTDGVMEIGRYIDFHQTDASTNDYAIRMDATTASLVISGGYTQSAESMRAPIFYDSNDTTYYVNPAGDSYNLGTSRALAEVSGWVVSYGGYNENYAQWIETEDATQLYGYGDTSVGMVHRARRVKSGQTVRFTITLKSSVAVTSGLYLRLQVYNGNLPDGKTHVSNAATASSPFVQEDSAQITSWYENGALGTSWQTEYFEYTATADCYISLLVLNWTGAGTARFYVKNPDIQVVQTQQSIYYDDDATAYYADFGSTGDSIRTAGDIVAYYSSDRRLKDNIIKINSALDKVNAIGGYTFEWNEVSHKETGKKDVGVVAQEVEEIFPEIVQTRSNGYKAVNYEKLVPLLIEAVKDQQTQLDELKEKVCKCCE